MFNLPSKSQEQTKDKVWKRWRPCQATDFQSLMYPCFVFCYILGIFPYKINASFKISKSRYILSTVVVCVVCVYQLVILYNLNNFTNLEFVNIPVDFETNCYYILSSFTVIITYILSGPRMRLLQAIMEVSSKLPSESHQKLSRLIHAKDIFSFFLLLMLMVICYIMLNFSFLLTLYTIYITLVVFQMDMLYINCVCILKACFKRINDSLMNLFKPVVNDTPCSFNQIYHEQEHPFLLMELKALKKQHLIISNTVQMLNLIFSLQLLASIIQAFFEITISLYFFIKDWSNFTSDWLNGSQVIIWYSYFLFQIYHVVKISSIVWICETGKNQALEIGTTVHVMLNSTSDEQVKNELQEFSLQILHCDNTFSARGLNVNAAFFAAFIGNVTTYVLILFQFLSILKSCEEKSTGSIT